MGRAATVLPAAPPANPILDAPAPNTGITLLDAFGAGVDQPAPRPPDVISVDHRKQLLADDWIVESSEGLTRVMHPVTKASIHPVLGPEEPWEKPAVLLYGTVFHDPQRTHDKFRMWYLCFTPTWNVDYSKVGDKRSGCVAYATSEDGIRWVRPRLGLHTFQGNRETNIVIPGAYGFAGVIHDPRDPNPGRRYKAQARTARGHEAFLSADGIHWGQGERMNVDGYDRSSVHWDPTRELWIASTKSWYRETPGGTLWRGRGYQESRSFVEWPVKASFMVGTPVAGSDIVYGLEMFYYESLFLGSWGRYRHEPDGLLDVQLAVSRNARDWSRPSAESWITLSPLPPNFVRRKIPRTPDTGVDPLDPRVPWDYGNNSVNSVGPVRVGDELWVYYSGRSSDHRSNPQTGAIGLGKLRLDGFFSLDAGEKTGRLLTRPLRLANDVLKLNADASGGEVRVEIVDRDGRPVPPFTLANCDPITSDGLRAPVTWKGKADLGAVRGRVVQLRIFLRNARLFAFWTGDELIWSTPDTATWSRSE